MGNSWKWQVIQLLYKYLSLKHFKLKLVDIINFVHVKGSSYRHNLCFAPLSFHGSSFYTSCVLPSSLTSSSIHLHVSYFIHFLLPLFLTPSLLQAKANTSVLKPKFWCSHKTLRYDEVLHPIILQSVLKCCLLCSCYYLPVPRSLQYIMTTRGASYLARSFKRIALWWWQVQVHKLMESNWGVLFKGRTGIKHANHTLSTDVTLTN